MLTADAHQYERARQSWDTTTRPKYAHRQWSDEQSDALHRIDVGVSHDDEELKANSSRWLYIKGPPGSGKTLLLIEAAIRCAKKGVRVFIVCPTCANSYVFKSQLPEFDGIDKSPSTQSRARSSTSAPALTLKSLGLLVPRFDVPMSFYATRLHSVRTLIGSASIHRCGSNYSQSRQAAYAGCSATEWNQLS